MKPQFQILNGLRGIAAIMVVWFHIFEGFATSHLDQRINHGYLAVDFFFLLSGFVIGYAYDDRWKEMHTWVFFKRRLIRLQPMIIFGAILGGIMFFIHKTYLWDTKVFTLAALGFAMLLNALLIPAMPGKEIRGYGEMYPLNGPSWSMFFEYIANILYAFIIRRLSIPALCVLVGFAAIGLTHYAIFGPNGDINAGWTFTAIEIRAGFFRVLFSFTAGLLIYRLFKPAKNIHYSFWISTILLITLFALPRFGDADSLWKNGIYDSICFLFIFPTILYFCASESNISPLTERICKFLGDLSYPLYIIHYPFMYLYFSWVQTKQLTFEESLPGALTVFLGCIMLALLCVRFYDNPIRKWLGKRYL